MWTKLLAAALLVFATGVVASVTRPSRHPSPPAAGAIAPPPGEAEAALTRPIPRVRLERVPFDEAVRQLHKLSGTNVVVQWQNLEAEYGFDRRTPVDIDLRDVTMPQAIGRVLEGVQEPDGFGPWYAVRDGIIVISTSDEVHRDDLLRVYDVRDIIDQITPKRQPPPEPPGSSVAGERLRDLGASADRCCGRWEEPVEVLTRFLFEVVSPDSWRETGGAIGSMQEFSGRLIVTHTPENHRRIEALLTALRRLPALEPSATRPAVPRPYVLYPVAGDAERKLEQVIPRLRLERVPFPQAVAALRDATGANIWVDWPALEANGFDRNIMVESDLGDVTLAEALGATLAIAKTPTALPDYTIIDGIIVISGVWEVIQNPIVRAYWVGDLIEAMRSDETRPAWAPEASGSPEVDIERVIREGVSADPDWENEASPMMGTFRRMGNWLVVQQTWANHRKMEAVVNRLRDSGLHTRPSVPQPAGEGEQR